MTTAGFGGVSNGSEAPTNISMRRQLEMWFLWC